MENIPIDVVAKHKDAPKTEERWMGEGTPRRAGNNLKSISFEVIVKIPQKLLLLLILHLHRLFQLGTDVGEGTYGCGNQQTVVNMQSE